MTHLPAQFVVSSNVVLDGIGRTVVSFEPYFASSSAFADPRTSTEMQSLSGLHATSVAYDDRSRPICQMYAPAPNGAYVAAPTTPSQCVSSSAENASYRRATRTAYGVDGTLDGRNYLTVDVTPDWAATGATAARAYADAMGRTRYTRTPTGTYEQTMYDLLGERTTVIRTPGSPATPTPSVTSSWTYDKRGRVKSEYSDAAGTKTYTYLPTGELVQSLQNASVITDKNATWSVFMLGAFGRVVERDDNRFVLQVADNCQQTAAVTDVTTYQFDTAYQALTGRYGTATAGLMTAAFTTKSTLAFGFDAQQVPQVRDEWTPDNAQHTVSELFGIDGRLLQRTITSPSLNSYSAAGTVGYAVGYDSLGRPTKMIGPYQPATFAATLSPYAISSATPANTLWSAGTGSDPTTGPYDALNRLANEQWDAGAIGKARTFLPYSNLLGSDATTGASSNNIYSVQYSSWQGSLVAGYKVTSHQDGGGTAHSAGYDADGHLTACPLCQHA